MPDTPKPVSEEDAHIVLLKLRQHVHRHGGQSASSPVLHEPDTGWGSHWVISWEPCALYPWPILVTGGGIDDYTGARIPPADFPAAVFCEPVNACEMGIYPPHTWDETAPAAP